MELVRVEGSDVLETVRIIPVMNDLFRNSPIIESIQHVEQIDGILRLIRDLVGIP